MATRKSTKRQTTTAQAPADNARALWLAGLGAVSIARKRSGEALVEMIGEGRQFQSHAQKLAREIRADAKAQANGALAPVRAAVRQNVRKASELVHNVVTATLAKLGIPSKADIEELTLRVAALSRQLKAAK